jgi:glycosyltransferase involved in cell wall biosynthesis
VISVIVPTYNQESFLKRAIQSIWNQGRDDLEVIIVDDGSTDDTNNVLRQLTAQRALKVLRQENRGPAAARNAGIRESSGDLIAFLDADDEWLPGKLEQQLAVMRGSGYRYAYCGWQVMDDGDNVIAIRPALRDDSVFDQLIWGNSIATPTVMIQRSLLNECGLFDEQLWTGEDWDLWLRLAAKGRGACVPQPLVAVRGGRRWHADAIQLAALEQSTNTVINRILQIAACDDQLSHVLNTKNKLRSWHFAVLTKSLLRAGKFRRGLSYAARSVANSPRGLLFLAPLGLATNPKHGNSTAHE